MSTVFDDPRSFKVKHPLMHEWTLWYDSPKSKALPRQPDDGIEGALTVKSGWLADLRRVTKFDSVEGFWATYNNVIAPSELPLKANYYCFKTNILPAWEDCKNRLGGTWTFQVPRRIALGVIDDLWLDTLLGAIGGTLDPFDPQEGWKTADAEMITGVAIAVRADFYRISIWLKASPEHADSLELCPQALEKSLISTGRAFKDAISFGKDASLDPKILSPQVVFTSHKVEGPKGDRKKIIV